MFLKTICFLLPGILFLSGNISLAASAEDIPSATAALSSIPSVTEASPEIASATLEAVTTKEIMDVVDDSAEALVTGVSEAIQSTRRSIFDRLGGSTSFIARQVDRLLSIIAADLFGWPIWLYGFSFLIIFISYLLRQKAAQWILNIIIAITSRTKTKLDDELVAIFKVLIPPLRMAITLIGIYIAVQVFFTGHPLHKPPVSLLDQFRFLFRGLFYLIMLGNIAWALCRLADLGVEMLSRISEERETALDQTFIPIARRSLKTFIIIIVTLQGLNYFEFGTIVNSLLAAAGVSGLAIGLAAQDTIKNFFGSIVLLVDRPFSVGDWIVAGATEGIVESVGIRSTKIRTFGKTLVTIPNSHIVDRDIDNISRRRVRRISFTLGVSYQSKPEQLEELLRRIRDLLRSDEDVWPNTILVRFTDFGESSLNIFIYYFSKTTVWDEHLAVREKINLRIMQIVEELGLEIAFPTQTVYLRNENPLPETKAK